jgi:16S rRNA (uracil1498-N3)-methyltransferase
LKTTDKCSLNLIFHPEAAGNNFSLHKADTAINKVSLLVGPESGFSDGEVGQAIAAGFKTVRMGPRWMRTETAAPMACAIVLSHLGELS